MSMSWHEGVQVGIDDARGRYVEATRDIEPGGLLFCPCHSPNATVNLPDPRLLHNAGEVLLSEPCAAAMVYRNADPPCCSFCLGTLKEDPVQKFRCDGCKMECYCSAACMDEARRSYHSSEGECVAFEAGMEAEATTGFEFGDVPTRFLLRVVSQAGGWRAPGCAMEGPKLERVRTLRAHVPEPNTEEHRRLAGISRNTLRLMDESVQDGVRLVGIFGGERYREAELTRLMCGVNCNSHTLYAHDRSSLVPVGIAVYVQGSAFNHSCVPSAEFCNVGTSLVVRSLRRVRAGEEITVSYVPTTMTLEERRRCLEGQFKFSCVCARCVAEDGLLGSGDAWGKDGRP